MGTHRRSQTGRTNFRLNDLNANAFYKEGFPTSEWQLHSTLHWESAPQCPLPTGKLHCCYDENGCHVGKRSKLLIGGWSLAGVWLFGKWALLSYMARKTIWQPQQLVKIICFFIEAEGLFWGMAIEAVFCTNWRPQSYQCPFIKKAASEDTGLCSVISCSLFIPFRSWAVTGLPSNALGCLITAVLREVETVLTA